MEDMKKIMNGLDEQRRSGKYCDVQIVVKGKSGEEMGIIKAHKSILATRSTRLERMFQEEGGDSVVISQIDCETLNWLIDYIYANSFEVGTVTEKNIMKILDGAKYLELGGLETALFSKLRETLSAKDAIRWMKTLPCGSDSLMDLVNGYDSLMDLLGDVLLKNTEELCAAPELKELSSVQLGRIVSQAKSLKRNGMEGKVLKLLFLWLKEDAGKRDADVVGFIKQLSLDEVNLASMDLDFSADPAWCTIIPSSVLALITGFQRLLCGVQRMPVKRGRPFESKTKSGHALKKRKRSSRGTSSSSTWSLEYSHKIPYGKGKEAVPSSSSTSGASVRKSQRRRSVEPIELSSASQSSNRKGLVSEMSVSSHSSAETADLSIFYLSRGTLCCIDIIDQRSVGTGRVVVEKLKPRFGHCVSFYENKIYILGGRGDGKREYQGVLVYDVVEDKMDSSFPDMIEKRSNFQTVILDQYLYAIGGNVGTPVGLACNCVERICLNDPNPKWEKVDFLIRCRDAFGAGILDGKIFVVGGYRAVLDEEEEDANVLCLISKSMESYDPGTDEWQEEKPMPTERAGLCAVVVDGLLYAIGGSNKDKGGKKLKTVEIYDHSQKTWSDGIPMNKARQNASAVVSGELIYVIGGDANRTIEKFNVRTKQWTLLPIDRLAGDFTSVAHNYFEQK